MKSNWTAVEQRLADSSTPELVASLFQTHYENLCADRETYLLESNISAVESLLDAETLGPQFTEKGKESLSQTAVLKLNGGLGTSMGLQGPKSLLKVRGEATFLDLILNQTQRLGIPLVLMNSFSTQRQTDDAIARHGSRDGDVMSFMQHQVPKLDAQTLAPIDWPDHPELQWCPPGHGDIYAALVTSGTLEKLLSKGIRFLFVSNADNLGATLDMAILGHFVVSEKSFLMEVADRTAADRKGGHLARAKDGGLLLREKAQCHPDEIELFQDISKHRFFNTNNLWINLEMLSEFLAGNAQTIPLPTIVNEKNVDPNRPTSPKVYQLETAMGAAIEVLPKSDAIRVPRSRFAPVKTTGDLVAVRSDAYEQREDSSVALVAQRQGIPPNLQLDGQFYKTIADLEQRIPSPPSLKECESLTVEGDLSFEPDVTIIGNATLTACGPSRVVPAGRYSGRTDFSDS